MKMLFPEKYVPLSVQSNNKMKKIFFVAVTLLSVACQQQQMLFTNPALRHGAADPTIFRAPDKYFYLYSEENIWRSKNLLDWDSVGRFFTDESYPRWGTDKAGIWAPDINLINGRYVLYYTHAEPFCYNTCGIGVAVADDPKGPFTDVGPLIKSDSIGVKNSIDQFYIEEDGHKYLIWGSFEGIYGIELTDDGLALRPGAEKFPVVGVGIEASLIFKKDGYYYYFGSVDGCCAGAESTYKVIVGRSDSLFGTYLASDGQPMTYKHYDLVICGDSTFAGPGHNAEIITDGAGTDWLIYHSYLKESPQLGRLLCISPLEWENGFPKAKGGTPSGRFTAPVFNSKR
jgi:arabinan endo-1,5-alpha-L-arabinosidase